MRHLNEPHFKRLNDLTVGLYFKSQDRLVPDDFLNWVAERTHVMARVVAPLSKLMDRLTVSWGPQGKPGNIEDIHDTCVLLRDMLSEMVNHEEVLRFTKIPEEGEELRSLLVGAVGKNTDSLREFPDFLDNAVALIGTDHGGTKENPLMLPWTYEFSLPENLNENTEKALARYENQFRL